MKISFSTLACPDYSWVDIYSMAKDLGFGGIEIRGLGEDIFAVNARPFTDERLPKTLEKLRSLGLEIPCLASGCGLKYKEDFDKNISEITQYIVLAKKLKRQITLFRFSGFAQSIAFFVMILTPSGTVATVCAILMGVVIFISTPSLFTLPARMPGANPQKVAVIMTLYWTGAYILQMIVYAVIVHLANVTTWKTAMLFTAFYSLTFLVGTFLLPDFDKPRTREERAQNR